MKRQLVFSLIIYVLLFGCTSSKEHPTVQKELGRPETKKLEAATVVGYDGVAVRKRVDNVLDKNDDRTKDTEKQAAETR